MLPQSSFFTSWYADELPSVFDRFPATGNPFMVGIMDEDEEETEDVMIDQREVGVTFNTHIMQLSNSLLLVVVAHEGGRCSQ